MAPPGRSEERTCRLLLGSPQPAGRAQPGFPSRLCWVCGGAAAIHGQSLAPGPARGGTSRPPSPPPAPRFSFPFCSPAEPRPRGPLAHCVPRWLGPAFRELEGGRRRCPVGARSRSHPAAGGHRCPESLGVPDRSPSLPP